MSVTHYVKVMALAGLVFSFQSAIQAQTEPIAQNTQLLGNWNGGFCSSAQVDQFAVRFLLGTS